MAQYELPVHLQGRHRKQKLSEIATAGIGGGLPAHISIQGNAFTLIDAAGNQQASEPVIQCAIADISSVMCKMYYGKEYVPGTNEPPVCWSTNGVAPSRDAIEPQNTDCATCPNNERGSAVSKMSGASIKACRDEKHLAVYLPKWPEMLFRLVITPGSFKNWSAFTKAFQGQNVDLSDVLVEIGFQPKTNGVLTFRALDYLDPASAAACDQAAQDGTTDALVGRNDVPWAGYQRSIGTGTNPSTTTISLPAGHYEAANPKNQPLNPMPKPAPRTSPQPIRPSEEPHPANAPPEPPPPSRPENPAVPPEPQVKTRHRRTKAEMEAARTQGAGNGQEATQRAPFRPAPPPGNFGISQGAAPNPEVKGMLDGIFRK